MSPRQNIAMARKYKKLVIENPNSVDTSVRTPAQWIKYYDRIIKKNQKVLDSKPNYSLYAMLLFLFVSMFGAMMYSDVALQGDLTGYAIKGDGTLDLDKVEVVKSSTFKLMQKEYKLGSNFKNKIKFDRGEVIELPNDVSNISVEEFNGGRTVNLDNLVMVQVDEKVYRLKNFNKRKARLGDRWDPDKVILIVSKLVSRNANDILVDYETNSPDVVEEVIPLNKKKVIVSSQTHYENISAVTELPIQIKGEQAVLKWIKNNSVEILPIDGYLDNDNDGMFDHIEWTIPHLSTQEFEIEINLLNIQSYPVVGGNWTVIFNTTGTSDLIITPVDTTWSDTTELEDLKLLEIRCGDDPVNYIWNGTSVIVPDYSCNETGYEVSKVITSGVHKLNFTFGQNSMMAGNDATNAPTIDSIVLNSTFGQNASNEELTVHVTSSDLDGDDVKEIIDWRVEDVSIGYLYPFEGGSDGSQTREYSSFGANATVGGATWNRTAGYDGFGAYEFDGNDWINSTIDALVKTISFRFNPNQTYGASSGRVNLLRQNDFEIFILNGTLYFKYYDDNITATGNSWNAGTWYTVFGSYDGKNMSLTIDDTQEATTVVSAPFIFQNSGGTTVASIFENGDIDIAGSCFATTCSTPSDDSFIVQDNLGDTVAFFNSTGDFCIEDTTCAGYDNTCDSAPDGSFIVQDSAGSNVAYIDSSGNLCTIGQVNEG